MRRLRQLWSSLTPKEQSRLRYAAGAIAAVAGSVALRWLGTAAVAGASAFAAASLVEAPSPGIETGISDPPSAPQPAPLGHGPARDELPAELEGDPVEAARAAIDAQQAAKKGTTGPDVVTDPLTLATPSQRGCRSGPFVQNFSSRNGARPALAPLHITVSHNRPGWGDVDAIVNWFNQTRSQASSNYVIDAEGNCAYIVNEANKAWTQGFFNPWSISIELIHFSTTDPNEPWPDAQLRKAALVFADVSRRWGIPIRLVNPEGCSFVAGITDHDRLECGNTHVDVGTQEAGDGVHVGTFPMTKFLRYVRQAATPRVRFYLMDGEGKQLARSAAVRPGGRAERLRYRKFGDVQEATALRELRADGDIVIRRRKAA